MDRRKVAIAILAVAGLVTACSSSGNRDASTSSASTSPSAAKLSGDPIKIVSIASVSGPVVQPEVAATVKAAVASVNASGGIDGRPLQVTVCDDKATSDGMLACARSATQDPAVVASVGGVSLQGADYGQALNKAGIPMIAQFPSASWELTTPGVYPIASGTIGGVLGISRLLEKNGFKRPALIRPDIAQAAVVPQLLNAGSVKLAADVTSPIGAADMTSYVTSALQHHPDVVVVTLDDLQSAQVIQAVYQQGGGKVKVLIVADRFGSDQLKALGPAQDIVLGVMEMPPSTASQVPAVTQWIHDLDQYGSKDTTLLTSLSENADIGIHLFAEMATALAKAGTTITRQSILTALKSAASINTYGATGPLNFHAPAKGLPFPLPNVYGVTVWYAKASQNTWQLDGQRVDIAGPA